MKKKLSAIGNSLGFVIEKPILNLLGIDRRTELEVTTDGKSLIIRPIRKPEKRINKASVIDDTLARIIDVIKSAFTPERIILFGSRADGTHREDSDYDLCCVFLKLDQSQLKTAGKIVSALVRNKIYAEVDVLVVTETDLGSNAGAFEDVKTKGVIVYESERRAAS